ncbi:nitrite reductase (NADH) large subunit [Devosia crocina]|uniref:Nitrite reductase (NADH) large subunit n=1 Tax=Devosia crocina TaxID=429728 RepID=A0A1I7N1Y0_9HYPH|nr:FAD-dependent oxidoreductase [Devosia crocina]SFV28566.1 nitrite reductase (NADH) large subunit [Devosia crocina]
MEKLVVIGAGMASGRFLEHLTERNRERFEITLFGAEALGTYNRILLSPVLAGEMALDEIVTHGPDWYRERGITVHLGNAVTAIDRGKRQVISRRGATPYDRLVIATGSAPAMPPLPGIGLRGVTAFRDIDDLQRMLRVAQVPGRRAVVIGGGLLGLEAAAALHQRGMTVSVLHLKGHLMDRQLDPASAALLAREFERRGIRIVLGAATRAILGSGHVEAVALEDGSVIEADLVVMAAGIRPETRLATDAGLYVERGIVVDDGMATSDPAVLALGECAEHDGVCYGLVAPLYDMARVAAARLHGGEATFRPVRTATQLKVSGVSVFSAGDFAGAGDREDIVLQDEAAGAYRRLVLKDGRLLGAVLYGDVTDGSWFFDLVREGADTAPIRELMIFGRGLADSAALEPYGGRCSLPG